MSLWNKTINDIGFYGKPLLLILLLNLLFFCCFGMYFDTYEGIVSTILQGTYSVPIRNWWDVNIHFVLMSAYIQLFRIFPDTYNIYGMILFVYNWVSLTFLGLVLYRILKVNLSVSNTFIFLLLYCLLCADNFVNLNSTRQAFVLVTAVLGFIESRRIEMKTVTLLEWIFIFFVIFFAALIRFEAVLTFSVLYILLLFIYRRFTRAALIPFFTSALLFVAYSLIISNYSTEAKKVFAYKEKEIIVRDNIDYARLSREQLLDIDALKHYYMADRQHFTLAFYDAVNKYRTRKGVFSFLDGVRAESFINTVLFSLSQFKEALYYLLFYLLSGVCLTSKQFPFRRRYFIHYLLLIFFPLLLCLHSDVPMRFLIPYLSVAGCINIIFYIHYRGVNTRLLVFCSFFLLLYLLKLNDAKNQYRYDADKFESVTGKLTGLAGSLKQDKPVIVFIGFPNSYFPVRPLDKLYRQNVLFFNFYLFSADEHNVRSWNNICHCNPLSVKEKIDYIVHNRNRFVTDEASFLFLKKYMYSKYQVNIAKTDISAFDTGSSVCHIQYEQ